MRILAEWLTDYIVREEAIKEDERKEFIYGFQTALEILLCIIISCILSYTLGMFKEGILFAIIFIPLRSYAGGLHLDNYWSCLLLSCLTFGTILVVSRFTNLRVEISFLGTIILLEAIWHMYPVENANRIIDEKEDIHFKRKLKHFLFMDLIIAIIYFIFKKETYLLVIFATLFMIAITMIIGKCKNLVSKNKISD